MILYECQNSTVAVREIQCYLYLRKLFDDGNIIITHHIKTGYEQKQYNVSEVDSTFSGRFSWPQHHNSINKKRSIMSVHFCLKRKY